MKAAAEGKRKAEMARRQNSLTQSPTDANQDCDSSPSHSSSVHRSQVYRLRLFLSYVCAKSKDTELHPVHCVFTSFYYYLFHLFNFVFFSYSQISAYCGVILFGVILLVYYQNF